MRLILVKCQKTTKLLRTRCFSQAQNAPKLVFGCGSAPDPAGELMMLPRPLVGWGRGHPSLLPLDAFSVSTDSTGSSFSTN